MSDVKINPVPQYKKPKEYGENLLKPENAMDLLDPGQNFQGEDFTESLQEERVAKAEQEEKERIEAEKRESENKKRDAQRKERRRAASRTGRRSTIITGPLGDPSQDNVRRPMLGR